MGLFDGETRYYAFGVSDELLTPDKYVNTLHSAVLSAVKYGEDLAKNIVFAANAGFNRNVKEFSRYGYNKYVFPPPVKKTYNFDIDESAVLTAVSEHTEKPESLIEIVSVYWEPPSINLANNRFIQYEGIYQAIQETLNITGGFSPNWYPEIEGPVYFTGSVYTHFWYEWEVVGTEEVLNPDTGEYETVDVFAWVEYSEVRNRIYEAFPLVEFDSSIEPESTDTKDVYKVTFLDITDYEEFNLDNKEDVVFYVTISIKQKYVIKYRFTYESSYPDLVRYFLYDPTDNAYPVLQSPELLGIEIEKEYLPVAILMNSKVPFNADINTEWYTTTVELVDKIGINAEEVLDALNAIDTQGAEKWDIFLHFGVPFDNPDNDTRKILSAYLNLWFKDKMVNSPNSKGEAVYIGGIGLFSIYKVGYSWSSLWELVHYAKPFNFGDWNLRTYGPDDEGRSLFSFTAWREYTNELGEKKWSEIRIEEFSQSFLINISGGRLRRAWSSDKENLYIDINQIVLKDLNGLDEEQFLQACLRGTMFLEKQEDVPWYAANSIWKAIFVIVVVVIIVITQQYQLSGVVFTVFGYAVTQMMILKFALLWIFNYLGSFVFQDEYVLMGFMLIVGIAMSGGLSNFASNFSFQNIVKQGFGTASQFISSVTKIANFIYKEYVKDQLKALSEDYENWLITAEEEQEQLERDYYGYAPHASSIDPFYIAYRNRTYKAEYPNEFFARSLQRNPGANAMQVIPNFVSTMVQLPKNGINPLSGVITAISGDNPNIAT